MQNWRTHWFFHSPKSNNQKQELAPAHLALLQPRHARRQLERVLRRACALPPEVDDEHEDDAEHDDGRDHDAEDERQVPTAAETTSLRSELDF